MRILKKKSPPAVQQTRARDARSRQRQRLIDACISALHIYGPSRTTVEKVVAIAKMSPGIVRFYFSSKAAMLVASLQFLAAEFEEQLLVPVTRLKSRPVAALQLMVDLYLDATIASPRKVSVWYAFWGEASSRQEYYDICGQKDESFAALVRQLIEALILETSQPHLDADGVALGLIGVLEILWQDFAFRAEHEIDRPAAKRRCMAYLRSVFPGRFAAPDGEPPAVPDGRRFAAWVYQDARLFSLERDSLFAYAWQIAGVNAQIPQPGNSFSIDLGVERAFVLRDASGEVRALRNSCSETPHALSAPVGGSGVIRCEVHGLQFNLDGTRRGNTSGANLTLLKVRQLGELILVRSAEQPRMHGSSDPWNNLSLPTTLRLLGPPSELVIRADWKVVVEQWLEWSFQKEIRSNQGWSARAYGALATASPDFDWRWQFVAPNHLIERRPDGVTILQVLPTGAGRCLLRKYPLTIFEQHRVACATQYLAARLNPRTGLASREIAESAQAGMIEFGHKAAPGTFVGSDSADFRRQLTALLPVMARDRPPTDA